MEGVPNLKNVLSWWGSKNDKMILFQTLMKFVLYRLEFSKMSEKSKNREMSTKKRGKVFYVLCFMICGNIDGANCFLMRGMMGQGLFWMDEIVIFELPMMGQILFSRKKLMGQILFSRKNWWGRDFFLEINWLGSDFFLRK